MLSATRRAGGLGGALLRRPVLFRASMSTQIQRNPVSAPPTALQEHDVVMRERAHPQPTRNPNLGIMTPAAADDLVAAIVESRARAPTRWWRASAIHGRGDAELYGPRPAWWWTGKAPQDTAGWMSWAGGGEGHLTSLPQLNLADCTREQVMNYFDNTWTLTEQLFASVQGEAPFYLQAYHQLRHPLIFYYGHVAALYVNKLRAAGAAERASRRALRGAV